MEKLFGDDYIRGRGGLEDFLNVGTAVIQRWEKLNGFPPPHKFREGGRLHNMWSISEVSAWIAANEELIVKLRFNQRKKRSV